MRLIFIKYPSFLIETSFILTDVNDCGVHFFPTKVPTEVRNRKEFLKIVQNKKIDVYLSFQKYLRDFRGIK